MDRLWMVIASFLVASCGALPSRFVPSDAGTERDSTDGVAADLPGEAGGCVRAQDCPTDRPVCALGGECVECTAVGQCSDDRTRPICDLVSNRCVPCAADSQCVTQGDGAGVCLLNAGACVFNSETLFVQGGPSCTSSASGGTPGAPFCSLQDAFLNIRDDVKAVVVSGTVPGAQVVWAAPLTIVGRANAIVAPNGLGPNLHIGGTSADVFVRDVTFSGSPDVGVLVENGATLHLDRTRFDGNRKGGLRVMGSGYDVTNSVFISNGGDRDAVVGYFGGAFLGNSPGFTAIFRFNTVVSNKQTGVVCEAATQSIQATLLWGNQGGGGAPDIGACTLVASKTSADGDPALTPEYGLTATSPCRNSVAGISGAPDHDFANTRRPQEGQLDCGAFEFVP